ncbi:unnamed protein product [Protopolystoma xenopodis]|uniref:Uncharacterized protein n=1 Tax=Protopolystoma xenopodis TaxID=117903 RepID=A0A3S5A4X5_9PLAT|nr:unnamed protein product [Protopolystoma xenopodis]
MPPSKQSHFNNLSDAGQVIRAPGHVAKPTSVSPPAGEQNETAKRLDRKGTQEGSPSHQPAGGSETQWKTDQPPAEGVRATKNVKREKR